MCRPIRRWFVRRQTGASSWSRRPKTLTLPKWHGEVIRTNYYPGGFLNAALDKASLENERNAVRIRMDNGIELTCVQIAGLVARRILCYVKTGDRLLKGQRFGFIRFGSRVDVYLPPQARTRVAVGDKVYAGETVLAELETATNGK